MGEDCGIVAVLACRLGATASRDMEGGREEKESVEKTSHAAAR